MFAPLPVAKGWALTSLVLFFLTHNPAPRLPVVSSLSHGSLCRGEDCVSKEEQSVKTQRYCGRRCYTFEVSVSLNRLLLLGTQRCRLSGNNAQPPSCPVESRATQQSQHVFLKCLRKYRRATVISEQLFSVTKKQSGHPQCARGGPAQRGAWLALLWATVFAGGRLCQQALVTSSAVVRTSPVPSPPASEAV